MPLPRCRLQTLMIAVVVVGFLLAPLVAWMRWPHDHEAWISIPGFTIRF